MVVLTSAYRNKWLSAAACCVIVALGTSGCNAPSGGGGGSSDGGGDANANANDNDNGAMGDGNGNGIDDGNANGGGDSGNVNGDANGNGDDANENDNGGDDNGDGGNSNGADGNGDGDDGEGNANGDDDNGNGQDGETGPRWHIAQENLASAFFAVTRGSTGEVYFVGTDADDGLGSAVLQMRGDEWSRLDTGTTGDLWWVHEVAPDEIWFCGESRMILRYTPSLGTFTVQNVLPGNEILFGIWGLASDDIWAVGGSAETTRGVLLHFDGETWSQVDLSPFANEGEQGLPQLFKVWGPSADEFYIVGAQGVTLRREGDTFVRMDTDTGRTLLTVNGTRDGSTVTAVGGFATGEIREFVEGEWVDVTPAGIVQMNGVSFNNIGTGIAGGLDATILRRTDGEWVAEADSTLDSVSDRGFHAVFIESNGNAWAVGGDILFEPFANGLIAFFGDENPTGPILEE